MALHIPDITSDMANVRGSMPALILIKCSL
jgi:hypothetical protein